MIKSKILLYFGSYTIFENSLEISFVGLFFKWNKDLKY